MFEKFKQADGSPSPNSLIQNVSLIESLYNLDRPAAVEVASESGSSLLFWESDPATITADVCVLQDEQSTLVAFAGTTNTAEALLEGLAAFYLDTENLTDRLINSFWEGIAVAFVQRYKASGWPVRPNVLLTGHSYGAAVAYLVARQLAIQGLFPAANIQLQTFGEPKSIDSRSDQFEPAVHDRVSSMRDPVVYFPPAVNVLGGLVKVIGQFSAALRTLVGFGWGQHGQWWTTQPDGSIALQTPGVLTQALLNTPFVQLATLGGFDVHSMDQGYIPAALRYWDLANGGQSA